MAGATDEPPSDSGSDDSRSQSTSTRRGGGGKKLPYDLPTMNLPIFFLWVLPLFCIALFSRNLADVTPKTIPVPPSPRRKPNPPTPSSASPVEAPSPPASLPASWPTDYKKQIRTIQKRRRSIPGFAGNIHAEVQKATVGSKKRNDKQKQTMTSTSTTRTEPNSPTANNDSPRQQLQNRISELVDAYNSGGKDLMQGILAADAMRMYDMQYHEGGTYEQPALELYGELVEKAWEQRGRVSGLSNSSCNDEVSLDYSEKSPDGVLCALYSGWGKMFYMSNMFERAVEAYNGCLEKIDPMYLDAVNSRGSSLIVLGRYEEAGRDFLKVINEDKNRFFMDAFTGLARVLEAKEEVVEGGWDTVVEPIEELIMMLSPQGNDPNAASVLGRLHHVLFTYNEAKTKDYSTAFHHLSLAHKFKLATLPKWSGEMEKMKVDQIKSIFRRGFWSQEMGSSTKVPIFIIGFVRSGSTLLERILDAHPSIAGTGENSVFNGRLDDIRNQIVKASNIGGDLGKVTKRLGDEVVEEMERRWKVIDANTGKESNEDLVSEPLRLADKMLTNYYNVGFIEMLFPNALILHVAREPMDSIFSAFKHNFPSGTLDYTSDIQGVADLYEAYRAVMDHWEEVLPGRVTHIRYEDMVNDFEGVARAIIAATGLPWHDDVLQFHKKKHAVNTYSSTQVRKGIYKSSMKSWMRYEKELRPLVKKVGARVRYDLATTVPGYTKPSPETTKRE